MNLLNFHSTFRFFVTGFTATKWNCMLKPRLNSRSKLIPDYRYLILDYLSAGLIAGFRPLILTFQRLRYSLGYYIDSYLIDIYIADLNNGYFQVVILAATGPPDSVI